MEKVIYAVADVMARPLSFVIIFLISAGAVSMGWLMDLGEGYWTVVNLGISLLTMVIGQAVLVESRRSSLAGDLKLDRIIEALPSDNDAIGTEKLPAAEIEKEKEAVERRTGN